VDRHDLESLAQRGNDEQSDPTDAEMCVRSMTIDGWSRGHRGQNLV